VRKDLDYNNDHCKHALVANVDTHLLVEQGLYYLDRLVAKLNLIADNCRHFFVVFPSEVVFLKVHEVVVACVNHEQSLG
jgi:hypothetical protein